MSEESTEKPRIGRREFFKKAGEIAGKAGLIAGGVVGAVATGAAMVGLAVSSRKQEALESDGIENDPVLSEIVIRNQGILDFEPTNDPDKLEQFYELARERRDQISAVIFDYPDKLRSLLRSNSNYQVRDKLKNVMSQNKRVFEEDIFRRKSSGDKIEWLVEEEITSWTGKVEIYLQHPHPNYFVFHSEDHGNFGLVTNQKLSNGANILIERGLRVGIGTILADDNTVKTI